MFFFLNYCYFVLVFVDDDRNVQGMINKIQEIELFYFIFYCIVLGVYIYIEYINVIMLNIDVNILYIVCLNIVLEKKD